MHLHSPTFRIRFTAPHCLLLIAFVFGVNKAQCQLQPGFHRQEYADMLWLQFNALGDSLAGQHNFALGPFSYKRLLLTPEVGLYNRASIFLRDDGVVVVKLRGTVGQQLSWAENFYAAMVPAKGSIRLSADYTLPYQMADDSAATVHVGWLVGSAFLFREMQPVLDSLVNAGHTQMIVAGHSQGGALAFLTTSLLHYYFMGKGKIVSLKTYASAAPKPGNLYYAYDFEHITRQSGGYRVVNTEDWVPETPFSIQSLADFREANPITNAKPALRQQKFLQRTYLTAVYNKMDKRTRKAVKTFRRQLGGGLGRIISKALPELETPVFSPSMNYSTAGIPIVLKPDSDYRQKFVFDGKNVFVHHSFAAYMHLLNISYPQ